MGGATWPVAPLPEAAGARVEAVHREGRRERVSVLLPEALQARTTTDRAAPSSTARRRARRQAARARAARLEAVHRGRNRRAGSQSPRGGQGGRRDAACGPAPQSRGGGLEAVHRGRKQRAGSQSASYQKPSTPASPPTEPMLFAESCVRQVGVGEATGDDHRGKPGSVSGQGSGSTPGPEGPGVHRGMQERFRTRRQILELLRRAGANTSGSQTLHHPEASSRARAAYFSCTPAPISSRSTRSKLSARPAMSSAVRARSAIG